MKAMNNLINPNVNPNAWPVTFALARSAADPGLVATERSRR